MMKLNRIELNLFMETNVSFMETNVSFMETNVSFMETK